jgi:hypothetical protein
MTRFVVDRDNPVVIVAESIDDAVEAYVTDAAADGWSDHFDVYARAEGDGTWRVFPVTTRVELMVTVGNGRPGPAVERDAMDSRGAP